jgi:competence protein ComEC
VNYTHAHNWPLFKAVPVLRILIPFVLGIVLNLVGLPFDNYVLLLLALMLICIALYKVLFKNFNRQILFHFVFLLLGYIHTNAHREDNYLDHFSNLSKGKYQIIINSIPEVKAKSVKVFAKVIRVGDCNSSGQLLLYFKKDANAIDLNYGDKIVANLVFKSIENIPNSNFDYRQYLANKQIYQQAYINSDEWKLIASNQGNHFVSIAYQCRESCRVVLHNSIRNYDAYAVASALLIGDDDDISKSVYKAYTDSGTIHVLSVSGMHVGVIYLLLVTLFGKLERNKYTKHFYFLIMLILIWLYSVLSGSSASVFRAATMLTVVIIGKWINGNSPIYNSLVLSMFALLLYNPFYLTDKGFILSYLAVFGIVYLQPKILSLSKVRNVIASKVWEFTSVSIAAQIMTLPVSLFLFGKFPNYFILANWVVIPLSTIAIYLSIAQIVFQQWTVALQMISFCNEKIICFMNDFLKSLTNLKGAVTNNISITAMECFLFYSMLFVIVDWLSTKRYNSLLLFLSCYTLLLVINLVFEIQALQLAQLESFINTNSFLGVF